MAKMVLIVFLIVAILFIIGEIYLRFFNNYCEPFFDKKTHIIKRKKNTEGVYKTKYTNSGYFRINNEGWNSHRSYFQRTFKKSDEIRIAIVGHSNIEGLRVKFNETLSKVFEDELIHNNINAEVYNFGYGGMHLAQALHVSRYVVENFEPDILIIGTLLDDFIHTKTNKKNFISLCLNENKNIIEVLPKGYEVEYESPLSFLFFSKLIEFIDTKLKLGEKLKNKSLLLSEGKNSKVLKNDRSDEQDILIAQKYILEEFKNINQKSKFKPEIYFIDFPFSIPSFNYNYTEQNELMYSNACYKKLIEQFYNYQFPVISLKQVLLDDYKENQITFDFYNDTHYNKHAHSVIGKYLACYFCDILKNKDERDFR